MPHKPKKKILSVGILLRSHHMSFSASHTGGYTFIKPSQSNAAREEKYNKDGFRLACSDALGIANDILYSDFIN